MLLVNLIYDSLLLLQLLLIEPVLSFINLKRDLILNLIIYFLLDYLKGKHDLNGYFLIFFILIVLFRKKDLKRLKRFKVKDKMILLGLVIFSLASSFYDLKASYFLLNCSFFKFNELEKQHTYLTLKQTCKQNQKLANLDQMTGLLNKTSGSKQIEERLKQAGHKVLVMIDIDDFKQINDTYGHIKGDEVICHLASILKQNIRHEDFASRFGGDEFIVFFDDYKDKAFVEHRIQTWYGLMQDFTCSMGVYFIDSKMDLNASLQKADQALYEAKHQGKGQYRIYNEMCRKNRQIEYKEIL